MKKDTASVCEEKNFRTLFDTYAEPLRNYMYYRCKDLDQAEDLVQEAFVKLWTNCLKVVFEKAGAWLYTVARNTHYNQVAHDKVVLEYEKAASNPVEHETPEFQLEAKEYMERLQEAINALPDGQREVFLLNRVDKVTYAEIASLLGISQTAVEKRMQKALLKMKEFLKN